MPAHFAALGGVELGLPNRKDCHAGADLAEEAEAAITVSAEFSESQVLEGEQLQSRIEIAQRFLSGEWGVELVTYEADQAREHQQAKENP